MNQQLAQAIINYQPNEQTLDLIRRNQAAFLVGISGAGKDTIKQALLATGKFGDLISHTTRAPRSNNGILEQNGREYYFIDDQQALEMIENKAFIEAKNVHGTVYGTSAASFAAAAADGKIPITDIDVQGVEEYRQLRADIVPIFIIPPDYVTWVKRLKQRYPNDDQFGQVWAKRHASAIKEIEFALAQDYYYFVINDDLDLAIKTVKNIFENPDNYPQNPQNKLIAQKLLAEIKQN